MSDQDHNNNNKVDHMSYFSAFLAKLLPKSFTPISDDPKATHQLIYAVFTGDLVNTDRLLKAGIRPNQEMMYFSIGAQQYEITALLLQNKPPQDSQYFHFAYQNMDEKMRDLLIEYKMKPNLDTQEMRVFMQLS